MLACHCVRARTTTLACRPLDAEWPPKKRTDKRVNSYWRVVADVGFLNFIAHTAK